jgi:hypothetical protein
MDEKELQKILSRLDELEAWVAERKKQQLSFPIDNPSRQIINSTLLVQTGAFFADVTLAESGYLPVTVNGAKFKLMVTNG